MASLFDSINKFQFAPLNPECSIFDRIFPEPTGVSPPAGDTTSDGEIPLPCDYFGSVYDYIKQILMEEDDPDQDLFALQAAEKYFHDALWENNSAPNHENSSQFDQIGIQFDEITESPVETLSDDCFNFVDHGSNEKAIEVDTGEENEQHSKNDDSIKKITRNRDDNDCVEESRNSKQIASYMKEESEQTEQYDKSLLCPKRNPGFYKDSPNCNSEEIFHDSEDEKMKLYRKSTEVKRCRPKGSKNQSKSSEVIDLRQLLTQCAEAVSAFNISAGEEILRFVNTLRLMETQTKD